MVYAAKEIYMWRLTLSPCVAEHLIRNSRGINQKCRDFKFFDHQTNSVDHIFRKKEIKRAPSVMSEIFCVVSKSGTLTYPFKTRLSQDHFCLSSQSSLTEESLDQMGAHQQSWMLTSDLAFWRAPLWSHGHSTCTRVGRSWTLTYQDMTLV